VNPKVKQLLKSVHICQSYRKNKSGTFFNDPRCRNNLYCQKLESLAYIFAADSMGIRLLLFIQLSLNVKPLSLKCWHENRVWHEIATQGHSRSFILQSVTSRQRTAYRHVIILVLTQKFPKK